VPGFTCKSVERDLAVNTPLAAWLAVIVDDPAAKILRIFPETVATFGLEEVKDQTPGELVVGGVTTIFPTPIAVVIVGKGPKIVVVALANGVSATPIKVSASTSADPRAGLLRAFDAPNLSASQVVFTGQLSLQLVQNLRFNARANQRVTK